MSATPNPATEPQFKVDDLVTYRSCFRDVGRVLEVKPAMDRNNVAVFDYKIQWLKIENEQAGTIEDADPDDISVEPGNILALAPNQEL